MADHKVRKKRTSTEMITETASVRDQAVMDALRPMAVGFSVLLAIQLGFSLFFERWFQAWIDGFCLMVFLVAWILLSRFNTLKKYGHFILTAFGLILLANALQSFAVNFGMRTSAELYVAIVVIGSGVAMTSVPHFMFLLLLTLIGWSAVTAFHENTYLYIRKLIQFSTAIGFSVLIFWSRLRNYARLERELTERKNTANALKRSELRYRALIDNQGEGMAIFERNGRIRFCNPAMEEIFGEPPEQLEGRQLMELMSLSAWKTFSADTKGCEAGKRARFELELEREEAESRHLLVTVTPMVDEEGESPKLHGLFRDITDRKLSELKQRKLANQIQQAQKLESLGVLAGGIAHDFNNILMGVMGNADIVKHDGALQGESRECVDEILVASRRAAGLCRQMLGYSGKGKFVIDHINLSKIIKDMAHLLEIPTTKKAIIKYQLSEVLPAIEADPTQLDQVVVNLVTNASEAIDKTDGEIIITTNVTHLDQSYVPQMYLPVSLKSGTYVSLEVTDNGCGMDENTKKHVFDPFFSTKFIGRGMGLAAVLGIVRGHNGTVEVYSEVGRGSSFRILFPAVDAPVSASATPVLESTEWVGHGLVLLVDDEPTVLRVGVRMLKQMGFSVITATDGVDAIEIFRARHEEIDVVILDQTMPRMSGASAFRVMRELDPRTLVLLSSGYNETEIATELAPYGLVGFLPKPYDIKILRTRLKAVFEGGKAFESVAPETDH